MNQVHCQEAGGDSLMSKRLVLCSQIIRQGGYFQISYQHSAVLQRRCMELTEVKLLTGGPRLSHRAFIHLPELPQPSGFMGIAGLSGHCLPIC